MTDDVPSEGLRQAVEIDKICDRFEADLARGESEVAREAEPLICQIKL